MMMEQQSIFRAGISPVEGNKKIASIRTTIYNYAFCRSLDRAGQKSIFILKCDDGDDNSGLARQKYWEIQKLYKDVIGIDPNFSPDNTSGFTNSSLFQSERGEIYSTEVKRLKEMGLVEIDNNGLTTFKTDIFIKLFNIHEVVVDDVLHGEIRFKLDAIANKLSRLPILRSDNRALYHLASVVDDGTLGVTHVVRGQDKMSAIPYQEMLRIALGYEKKIFLHTPLMLDSNGKRLKGDYYFQNFLKKGVSFDALLTYIIKSGYGKSEQSYHNLDELISQFNPSDIHKSNGQYNKEKLDNINRKLIKNIDAERYYESLGIFLVTQDKNITMQAMEGDIELKNLICKVRLDFDKVVNFIEAVTNPIYIDPPSDRETVEHLISLLENNTKIDDIVKMFKDKKLFYESLGWILTGKETGAGSYQVYEYCHKSNIIEARIVEAKVVLGYS